MSRAVSESGEIILDKLPVPKNRESGPRLPTARPPRAPLDVKRLVLVGVGVGGLVLGFLLRPILTTDSRIGAAERDRVAAHEAAAKAESKATQLEADLAKAKSTIASTDVRVKVLQQAQDQVDDLAAHDAAKGKTTEARRALLAAALDKTSTATIAGDDVVLALSDKLLFKPGDDALTDKGKQTLAKLASVFKQSTELQIVVQGHTDDTPLVAPVTVAAPAPAPKGKKGKPAPAVAAPVVPVVRFKTNWELSAARALAIVHYFQDVAKLDPTRLSATAFSQYQPVSATATDAENRRLELVISPRRAVSTAE